jgi:hypothetical protein
MSKEKELSIIRRNQLGGYLGYVPTDLMYRLFSLLPVFIKRPVVILYVKRKVRLDFDGDLILLSGRKKKHFCANHLNSTIIVEKEEFDSKTFCPNSNEVVCINCNRRVT